MSNHNIKRHTSDSLQGRRMQQAKGAIYVDSRRSTITPEQAKWNAEVEKRQLKKEKKSCP